MKADLLEVLELISAVEKAQVENSENLRRLRRGRKNNPEPGEMPKPWLQSANNTSKNIRPQRSPSPGKNNRPSLNTAVLAPKKADAKKATKQRSVSPSPDRKSATRSKSLPKKPSAKGLSREKLSPYKVAKERLRSTGTISHEDLQQLIEKAYEDIHSAIDDYVDTILKQEISVLK